MNVDRDIFDGGCNGMERCSVIGVLSVIGEDRVEEEVDESDGVMNEGNKSSNTRVTRTVLTGSGVVWEGIGWQVLGWFI